MTEQKPFRLRFTRTVTVEYEPSDLLDGAETAEEMLADDLCAAESDPTMFFEGRTNTDDIEGEIVWIDE